MRPSAFLFSSLSVLCLAHHNFWQDTLPMGARTYTVPAVPSMYVETANGPQQVYFQPSLSWSMSSQPFFNNPVDTVLPVYVPLSTIMTNQQSNPHIYSIPSDQGNGEDENALILDQEDDRSSLLPVLSNCRTVSQTRAVGICVLTFFLLSVIAGLLTYFLTKKDYH